MRTPQRNLLARLALAVCSWSAGAGIASAQTDYIPYFGKNQIRYDNFKWQIYTTDHFEIYYYPEIEPHLEQIAGYAESAYQHVSSELKHDLAFKVPLILFSTSERVLAAERHSRRRAGRRRRVRRAEPLPHRDADGRTVGPALPADRPRAHPQFQYDIIPTVAHPPQHAAVGVRGHVGLHDRLWRPIDLMTVRDAAVADIVPKMSELQGYGNFGNPRLHLQPRPRRVRVHRSALGQGRRARSSSSRCARASSAAATTPSRKRSRSSADEWDQQFDRYLKERFKPFRDKERPADYGRDLAPNPAQDAASRNVLSIEPSPSGDLIAGDDRQRPRSRARHRADLDQGRLRSSAT